MRKIFPVFAIILSLVWMYMAYFDYGLWVRRGPGGGFFPFIGGLLTLIFSVNFLKDEIADPKPAEISGKFIYPIAALLAVFLSSYVIGMIPAMFVFIFLWLWRYEKFTWQFSLYVGLGTMAVLWGIFVYWLTVPLPKGMLLG